MPYKQTTTQCIVRLVALRGSRRRHARPVSGVARGGRTPLDGFGHPPCPRARPGTVALSAGELEQATKGGQYALHSQSVQALCQKFAANVETATELRRQEAG